MEDIYIPLQFLEAAKPFAFSAFDSPIGESVGLPAAAENTLPTLKKLSGKVFRHFHQLLTHILNKNWYGKPIITFIFIPLKLGTK
jgi:hypothetical protein